jgi:drug/metabolite transporter (DMT)-like permease
VESGIVYAVLAAFVWGGFLFALKRYFDGYSGAVLTVAVNGFATLWYLPVAAATLPPTGLRAVSAGAAAVGVLALTSLAIGAAFVLFVRALAAGEVSYVAPINKLVPAFVLPIEVFLLGQHLTGLQVTGVAVATLAVYVANYRRGSLLDPLRRAATSRPARLALLSAACYAVADVGKRLALQELALPTAVWVPALFVGSAVVLAPAAYRSWELPRADLPKFAAAGLVVAAGEHVTSLAFQLVPASIASPVINTQAIVAVVLGGLVLRERQFRTRLAAAGLAVAGVTLIAL